MTTPLLPEIADPTTFGGPFANHAPVVDPTTDMDASYQNLLNAQVAMLSHTAPRAWVRCTVSGGVVTVADHDAVWGNTSGVKPGHLRRDGELHGRMGGVLQRPARTRRRATRSACGVLMRAGSGSSAARIVNSRLSDAVTAEVTAYDAAGSAAELDQFTVTVW